MYRILFYNFNPLSVSNTHLGFQEIGCDIMTRTFFCTNLQDELLEKELCDDIDTFKPDIIFSYGWWRGRVNINTFCDFIHQKGIFHIYWAFDDPDCIDIISLPIGKKVDIVLTSVIECIEYYQKNGVKAYLFLHGCYPPHHRKVDPVDIYKHDIVLLANNYNVTWDPTYFSYRFNGINNILKPLVENDFDIKIWGLWWNAPDRIYNLPERNCGQTLSYGHEAEIYSSCKIALGLQTVGNSKSHFSVRTFETLGCGAFHLCQYSPALETYFRKGVHMEWTASPQETLDIVKFYLVHDMLRERIASQGQEEVYAKHTMAHRAKEALDIFKGFIKLPV